MKLCKKCQEEQPKRLKDEMCSISIAYCDYCGKQTITSKVVCIDCAVKHNLCYVCGKSLEEELPFVPKIRPVERIDRILELVRKAWNKHPDVRICQMFFNLTAIDKTDLFYLEDEEFEKILIDYLIKIEKAERENELVQYFIVNTDLNMSAGKIASQVAHASMLNALIQQNDEKFKQWMNVCMKKVVLGANEETIRKIMRIETFGFVNIVDKGFTEIPPNSLTVVGLPVMTRKEASQYVKGLKTLK